LSLVNIVCCTSLCDGAICCPEESCRVCVCPWVIR